MKYFFRFQVYLWDDGDTRPQFMQSNLCNVYPIYGDLSFCCLKDSEDSES